MNNLQEVCLLSCEKWIDSFPDNIPKHKFSKKHNKKIKEIFEADTKRNRHKFSKKTIKMLAIAAVLLCIATTAFAIPASREAIVQKFSNHSQYEVADFSNAKKVKSLAVNYIPNAFEITEEDKSDFYYILRYENADKYFTVEKFELSTSIGFDTEEYDSENIVINGINAIYFKADEVYKGLVFNNGDYIFVVSGNIEKNELVNIAENVE